jgi:4-amino-4-deoxy-L-arabinose transferase-like glycosyltransferase
MTAILAPTNVQPTRAHPPHPAGPSRPSPATFWRRRLIALAMLVALAFLLTVAIGRVGAEAELSDRVAGHVVLQPGQTLWDVAVATAPEGMDVRRQLVDIQELNELKAHEVEAWTVVLLPAR